MQTVARSIRSVQLGKHAGKGEIVQNIKERGSENSTLSPSFLKKGKIVVP
jgi:hypothetical protein